MGQKCRKIDPTPFFGSKIMNLLVFFDFEPKSVSGSRHHGVCLGRSGMSADAVYALFFFCHFWYVGVFGDLCDPVVPTLNTKGCKWGCCDRIYLLRIRKGVFCSL